MNKQMLTLIAITASSPVIGQATNNLPSSDNDNTRNNEIENVIVTATKLPRSIADIAGTVSVISAEELSRQVANDLDDLIRYQPGISMDTAGRGGNQGFIIRGIGGNRVLTLIDNVRSTDIYSAGPSSYGRDSFEVDDLRSVEIIRGPASVLYGADALGGAVILHTKSPEDYLSDIDDTYFALRTTGASANDQAKVGMTAATRYNDWAFMAQYTRREANESEIEGPGKLNPQDIESDALLLKSTWTPNETHKLTFIFDSLVEDIKTDMESDLSSSVFQSTGNDETERYRTSVHHHWKTETAFVDHIDTHLFWQETDSVQNTVQDRLSFSFPAPPPFSTPAIRNTDFEFNQTVAGLGTTLVKSFKNGSIEHAIVYGFNYEVTDTERPRNRCEINKITSAQTCDIVPFPFATAESFPNKSFPDTETTRSGIFLQNEMTLGNSGFTLIPGIRYDYYNMDAETRGHVSIDGFEVKSVTEHDTSVNLGLIYSLSDDISLFAQYAEGFRPPNFDEANQSYVNRGIAYGIVPNPDLEPESSKGYEMGVKATLPRTYLSFAIFDNHYDDFIATQYLGIENGLSLFQDRNIEEVRIYGAELVASVELSDQWKFNTSIAYAQGVNEITDRPLDSIEPLTGVFGLSYSPGDRWEVETVLTLVDKKDRVSSDTAVTAAGYGVVDVFGHYNITENIKLKAGVFNLLNKHYARWANIQGQDEGSSAIDNAQEAGIEYRFGMDWTF